MGKAGQIPRSQEGYQGTRCSLADRKFPVTILPPQEAGWTQLPGEVVAVAQARDRFAATLPVGFRVKLANFAAGNNKSPDDARSAGSSHLEDDFHTTVSFHPILKLCPRTDQCPDVAPLPGESCNEPRCDCYERQIAKPQSFPHHRCGQDACMNSFECE
jgi:hypothetical protein